MIEIKKDEESRAEEDMKRTTDVRRESAYPFAHSAVQLAVLLVRPLLFCDIV